jgi:hypothetical protein
MSVMNTRLNAISVAPAALTLARGSSALLAATGTFQNGFTMDVTQQVKWTSSNRAAVWAGNSQRGLVKGQSAGNATVTASRTGKSGAASVTVN